MTLNQLNYFIAVARYLSFTEAAKSLFLTQPALSRQIQAMEEELGTPLFVRDHKALKLTPGGLVLYNRLPRLLGEYQGLLEEVRGANQEYEGRLRVGVLDVYDITPLFPRVIAAFQARCPQVRLTLERFPLGELPELLCRGELDLICTYGFSLFEKPELVTVDIQKYDSCILLRRDHPLADKPELTLADLRQERFVQLSGQVHARGYAYICRLWERSGIHPPVLQVHKMEDVLLWVQSANYVAVTTNRTIERYHPQVVLRDIPLPEAKGHDIAMAWQKHNYNPAIALFMEGLEAEAEGCGGPPPA